MGTLDNALLERWGARGCSNSHYELVRSSCCGAFFVEDRELCVLYWNSNSPSARLNTFELERCPACSTAQWDYETLPNQPVLSTPWAWAYRSE